MITTFYPPYNFGGDGVFVHQLSSELARRGHDVHVVHCADSYRLLAGGEPAQTPNDHPGVTVHTLRSRLGRLSPLATYLTGRPLLKSARLREILATGFDVIHYHNISLVGGPGILSGIDGRTQRRGAHGCAAFGSEGQARRVRDCQFGKYGQAIKLYTIHEYWLVCPMNTLYRFNRAVCTRAHCGLCCLWYHRPPRLWSRSALVRAAAHVDAFLVGSRFTADVHRRMGLDLPMVYLPLFASTGGTQPRGTPDGAVRDRQSGGIASSQPATPAEPEPSASQAAFRIGEAHPAPALAHERCVRPSSMAQIPHFLAVARLEKLKGIETLIPVFRRYTKARLFIVGTGGEEARLRAMAADCDRIRFLGAVPHERMQSLYQGAAAVIVPSLWFEVSPLVILEALASGTPVIARNIGAVPERIRESGGGLIYDTDDQLPGLMDRLLGDPALARELGRRARQTYMERWTIQHHIDRYLELIHRIAEARHLSLPNGIPADETSNGETSHAQAA
jgi:glycosyltransferase involved in cell wall biosynthesis